MRPAQLTSVLCALCLFLTGARFSLAAPPPPPRAELSLTATDQKHPSWTVTAYGKTQEDADQVAEDKVRQVVRKWLNEQQPPLVWNPAPADLTAFIEDNHLVKSRDEGTHDFGGDLGEMKVRTVTVTVNAKTYEKVLENDRQERMRERQWLLGKVLAGLLVLLVAVGGYLRLEELTKGYYTLWLRLAAVGLVVGVGVALALVA